MLNQLLLLEMAKQLRNNADISQNLLSRIHIDNFWV